MNLIQHLAKAVHHQYRFESDPLKPGLVISQLSHTEWYVSIARYPGDGCVKQIEACAKGATLEEAALGCAMDWLVKRKRTRCLQRQTPRWLQVVVAELAK